MQFFDQALYAGADYDQLWSEFKWNIPASFNIGVAASRIGIKDPGRTALYYENDKGACRQYTFEQVLKDSNRLANALIGLGVKKGDRVAIVLPQRVEAGVAHIAVYSAGAVSVPLSVMFGEEALEYRLKDSGASIVITDSAHREVLESLRCSCPSIEKIID